MQCKSRLILINEEFLMSATAPVTYRSVLKERNVALLFTAQAISLLGSWISLIALNVRVYDLTRSSLGVAAVFLLTALPSLLFGIIGGVYVDRLKRKNLLVAMDFLRAGLT